MNGASGNGARVASVELFRIPVPLRAPYASAISVLREFDAIVAAATLGDGRTGFGEATIIPGYTPEDPGEAWAACRRWGSDAIGRAPGDVLAALDADPEAERLSHAACVIRAALELARGAPWASPSKAGARVPLLAPVNAKDPAEIEREVEALIAEGFRTLKVKVGWNVAQDLAGLSAIQKCAAGRAKLRVDANQGYTRDEALRFVAALDPADIELLEQPCDAGDWAANAAVGAAAPVPLMLDESIHSFADIERAGGVESCAFVKLKLGKMGGIARLIEGLNRIRELGMTPVLGNGAATDLTCWIEARVAADCIDNAGEMHGFLKVSRPLLAAPMAFEKGAIVVSGDAPPDLDRAFLDDAAVARAEFGL